MDIQRRQQFESGYLINLETYTYILNTKIYGVN